MTFGGICCLRKNKKMSTTTQKDTVCAKFNPFNSLFVCLRQLKCDIFMKTCVSLSQDQPLFFLHFFVFKILNKELSCSEVW